MGFRNGQQNSTNYNRGQHCTTTPAACRSLGNAAVEERKETALRERYLLDLCLPAHRLRCITFSRLRIRIVIRADPDEHR